MSNHSDNSEDPPEAAVVYLPKPPNQIEIDERDSYRKFCLARLSNFVQIRSELDASPDPETTLHRRIVERALYSAFRDCVAAGATPDAWGILNGIAAQAA